jgi:hypothetical protein
MNPLLYQVNDHEPVPLKELLRAIEGVLLDSEVEAIRRLRAGDELRVPGAIHEPFTVRAVGRSAQAVAIDYMRGQLCLAGSELLWLNLDLAGPKLSHTVFWKIVPVVDLDSRHL